VSPVRTATLERGGFSLTVPASWWEFDIHPASRDGNIRRLVGDRVRRFPDLAPHREVITKFLRGAARDAYDSGAVYCGCMAEDFGGVPVSAQVTVSLVGARTPDGNVLPTDPAAIAASLREKVARREHDTWRKVTTVHIPQVGQAARTYGVEDVEIPGGTRTVRSVLMQTFIPVPDSADRVALVAGSSAVLDLAEAFFDVFDAVTSTFRFLGATGPR
jgi:hypothetical protein